VNLALRVHSAAPAAEALEGARLCSPSPHQPSRARKNIVAVKKTYNPQKTFSTDLEGTVNFLVAKNFTCSVVDIEQLKQDVIKQHASKAAFEALKAAYLEARERFLEEQSERHMRYTQLLNAARGAFRHDKATLAALANFQRKGNRRSPNAETPHQDAAPVAQPSPVLPKIATA
jgi:hypothetical protein